MLRLLFSVLVGSCVCVLACGESGNDPDGGVDPGLQGPFEPGPTCEAFCARAFVECGAFILVAADCDGFSPVSTDEECCVQGCERPLATERLVSEACGNAVEGVFQCASELDCQGVYDWRDRVPIESYPCRAEVANVDAVCAVN